jgi:hypothetical protein
MATKKRATTEQEPDNRKPIRCSGHFSDDGSCENIASQYRPGWDIRWRWNCDECARRGAAEAAWGVYITS